MSNINLKSYLNSLYHNEELKSLTRYRFDKVSRSAKLKQSISMLVNILFLELEKIVSNLYMKSVYALLSEFTSAHHIAETHLTRLSKLLCEASNGRYNRDTAISFRDAVRNSIGSCFPAKSLELKHTIKLIIQLDTEIKEIE